MIDPQTITIADLARLGAKATCERCHKPYACPPTIGWVDGEEVRFCSTACALKEVKVGANKFSAIKATLPEYPGVTFDSRREARVVHDLWLRTKAVGADRIQDLALQPRFHLDVNGEHVCDYVGDALYCERIPPGEGGQKVPILARASDGSWLTALSSTPMAFRWVLIDAKSPATRTAAYRIKAKLLHACHGLTITEV